ncbi:MFS transporter [Nocardioides cheoyonin]|uniref:MFS transporter n=1 Tax=Nocardioides cheoyonin TaxID=3156615 RepID=UPI0032B3E5E3
MAVVARPDLQPGPDQGYRRDAATWVTFGALFAFGLLNAVLGPVLPYLRQSEHLSYVVSALHQVGFALGGMAAGALAIRSSAPRRPTIVVGLVGAALAGLLLGYGGVLPLTILAALLVSAFATAALIRMWALLSDLHGGHRAVAMTEGEVAVSLAGVLTPALVGLCAAGSLGWGFSTVIVSVLVAAAALAVGATRSPGGGAAPHLEPEGAGRAGSRTRRTRRTLTAIFAVVALEFTLSFWSASYLHDAVGIARDASVALVSALYAANLVGRLIASRVARRLSAPAVLYACLATALAGMPLLLSAHGLVTAGIGLAVTGAGIGGTFPLASSLHVAASRRTADQALGQTLTVAGVGQIAGPLAAGAIAQVDDLRLGLLVLPVLVVLAAASTRPAR